MTSQGSPYMRFRRALDHGNVTEALSAASELEQVGLAEALELCLLLRDRAPERFPRAALSWHGRYCREVDASLEEAQALLAALALMAGGGRGTPHSPSRTFSACEGGPELLEQRLFGPERMNGAGAERGEGESFTSNSAPRPSQKATPPSG